MTRVWNLYDQWYAEPPVDVLVASFLGYSAESEKKDIDLAKIESAFGAAIPEAALPSDVRASLAEMKADAKYIELLQSMKGGLPQ